MSKPTMKFDPVYTEFCITLSEADFESVIDYDDQAVWHNSLSVRLQDIQGVSDIDFDGMCGPNIFLSIATKHDNYKLRAAIKEIIWDAIQKGREHVR